MEKNNRILIVDDQKDLCEQLAKLLLQTGKANETISLVQQMRARLMGGKAAESETSNNDSENSLYEVEFVNQGQDAATKIQESLQKDNPYALVFLDMRMPPGWDGLETAKRIRELDKDVEIVIMTAYADHDQKQIAEKVGRPEKLLYIKKPFQAEEIYQLALSLTSKWNLEWTEKRRKKWLEAIIRGLCKLKSPASTKSMTGAFIPALKSFLDLMDSEKGMAVSLSGDKWTLHCCNGMSEDEAQSYLKENSAFLKECRTTKHKDDKYFLPLRKDDFFAMIVVFDVKTKNDPEWYKLLSILSMTVSDIVGECMERGDDALSNKHALLPLLMERLSKSTSEHLDAVMSNLGMIKEQGAEQLVLDLIAKSMRSSEDVRLEIRNALFCAGEIKPSPVNVELLPSIKAGVEAGAQGRAAFKFDGDGKIAAKADPALLRDVFANLARSSLLQCRQGDIWIEVKAAKEEGVVKLVFSDNGPGVAKERREKLFCPLSQENMHEMGLPVSSLILNELGGSIRIDQKPDGSGTLFLIELPSPSA